MIEEIIEKAKRENKKVYIYAHKFPDGDAISSSCAVTEYLKAQGIDAKYVVTNLVAQYSEIVDEIPTTSDVEEDQISLILDTGTVDYTENKLFKKSKPENTYVIDHHGKIKGATIIEDELGLPSENVIRNSNASSVCEILVNELQQSNITPEIANLLALGLLTDTAKLKFLKENTLKNLSTLIELGADYSKVIETCTRKASLKGEVGLAKEFLKARTFPLGDTFGIMLSLDNGEVNNLGTTYGIRCPQKRIFKFTDITDNGFTCMFAENTPGKYDVEFRSNQVYGNFDVLSLATSYGGGGHYNASGCCINKSTESSTSDIESTIEQQATNLYSAKATNLPEISLSEQDTELSTILTETDRLKKGVTPEILLQVDSLIKSDANYENIFKKFKSFKRFMLENELLSRIPESTYKWRNPRVKLYLSPEDVTSLREKYNVSEDEILEAIEIFGEINIDSVLISLPSRKSAQIDSSGKISKRTQNNPVSR